MLKLIQRLGVLLEFYKILSNSGVQSGLIELQGAGFEPAQVLNQCVSQNL